MPARLFIPSDAIYDNATLNGRPTQHFAMQSLWYLYLRKHFARRSFFCKIPIDNGSNVLAKYNHFEISN